jgi:hypothetical protein
MQAQITILNHWQFLNNFLKMVQIDSWKFGE